MERRAKERRKRADHAKERSNGIEELPDVLIEEILERTCVESLLRFTSVSKQWNSTIKSTSFASRHLIRAQSRDPSILLGGGRAWKEPHPFTYLKKWEFGSPELINCHIMPKPYRSISCAITGSCDGLVCVYYFQRWIHIKKEKKEKKRFIYIINPATRWCRSIPEPKYQQINRARGNLDGFTSETYPGFGKDTMTGKYKIVWLYNSLKLDLDGHTRCEVFDFSTSVWRYVTGSTHRIRRLSVYLDGSLHWLTRQFNGETKMIYFDLHTEVFKVMAEIPIVHASPGCTIMCCLNNRLCVSEKKINSQEIWSLNSDKVWEKTYSIYPSITSPWMDKDPLRPVTCFNKTGLLLFICWLIEYPCLLVQDTITGSCSIYFKASQLDQAISYIPSLISI